MKHTSHVEEVTEARRKECVLSGRKMSGGMVESPIEKNKSRSFHDAESLGLIDKEMINSQEQSLRQPEREIKVTELKRVKKFNIAARKQEINKGESGENCPLRREFWIQTWHIHLVAATGGHLLKSPRFSGLSINTNVTVYCNCSNAHFENH